jgi:hypothetical protein
VENLDRPPVQGTVPRKMCTHTDGRTGWIRVPSFCVCPDRRMDQSAFHLDVGGHGTLFCAFSCESVYHSCARVRCS